MGYSYKLAIVLSWGWMIMKDSLNYSKDSILTVGKRCEKTPNNIIVFG